MSTGDKEQMDAFVKLTDFFSGDREPEEVLAQPEACCGVLCSPSCLKSFDQIADAKDIGANATYA